MPDIERRPSGGSQGGEDEPGRFITEHSRSPGLFPPYVTERVSPP